MTGLVRFYCHEGPIDGARLEYLRTFSPEHVARLWRPDGLLSGPPGSRGYAHGVYAVFHRIGMFSNTDYSAIVIESAEGTPDHVASIFPGFFRFPFMARDDLQIGATQTRPEARGQRLAPRAILEAMAMLGKKGRRFWYLSDATNTASCRVAEVAGLSPAGEGARLARFGLAVFGAYELAARRADPQH